MTTVAQPLAQPHDAEHECPGAGRGPGTRVQALELDVLVPAGLDRGAHLEGVVRGRGDLRLGGGGLDGVFVELLEAHGISGSWG